MDKLASLPAGSIAVPTVFDVRTLRRTVGAWQARGGTVGLVPTMGALHEGHLHLVRQAFDRADRVVVSIFVNPMQFAPSEDFSAYPRRLAEDAEKLREEGVDLIYAPSPAVMYPEGFATRITVAGVSEGFCGAVRPGHFEGVATVVAKLLLQSQADIALFGLKDYQQFLVIRTLAEDLNIPCEVLGIPTVRDVDGLALSSRNAYLSHEERAVAPHLFATLNAMVERLATRRHDAAEVEAWGSARLRAAGFGRIDYLRFADDRLGPYAPDREGRLLAAVYLGRARLLDNIAVPPMA
ncbi:pantoate--beta-alanine ligase [Marinivivus vitaminiproducens]|uniref:pantoate--beta-alanine ligase n=1 Tax=Marinivivus vitaminiproducens TaxID=3035935 RepID=UPI00279D6DBD|nr:pantoate--beta-alanine ligase [Geminicoccaceae bacterium SCSIO 64248]